MTDQFSEDEDLEGETDNVAEDQRENSVPQNLQPYVFKPGQSGNPGGRPKGISSYQEITRRFGSMLLKDVLPVLPNKIVPQMTVMVASNPEITVKEAIVFVSAIKALSGDMFSRDFVANREEGCAPEKITITDERVVIDIEDDDEETASNSDTSDDDRDGERDGNV